MEKFKYLGTTAKNQKRVQEGSKRRLNLVNTCYHSVHNIFVFLSPYCTD